MNVYKKGMFVELDLESQVEFNRKKNLDQDGKLATLSSQVSQLLQQVPSGFLPRVYYGLTRGEQTYRFILDSIFTISGLDGQIGDAYELTTLLEQDSDYIPAVAVQINTNQVQIIIEGDYTIQTNFFNLANMRTGVVSVPIALTNTTKQDASYLGDYLAINNKEKQITVIKDLQSGRNNAIFASLDLNSDGLYNWIRIGSFTNGSDGRSIYGINNATANTVFTYIKYGDLILCGEDTNYYGFNGLKGDLFEYRSLSNPEFVFIGNFVGPKGNKGDRGENGTNGVNGLTPTIGENGNWYIGGVDTNINAQGIKGTNGVDGQSFNIQTGIYSTILNQGKANNLDVQGNALLELPTLPQTNISGKAYVVYDPLTTPLTPFYSLYWANNGDTDWSILTPYTGIAGRDGRDGNTPYIENNNWYIDGQNTGVAVTGPQGPQGIQGEKGVNPMGAWVDDNEYFVDDLVTYNGSAYICIKDHQNTATTPDVDVINWTLFVSKGDQGDRGNIGPAGPTPNISVTVTSLPAGSQPTATTTGTAESPIINLGIPSANNIRYVELTPSTAIQGTLTDDQLALLQESNINYIMLNDEIYTLADKQVDSGYLIYYHTGKDSVGAFFSKAITITISTRGWILSSTEIVSVDKLNSLSMLPSLSKIEFSAPVNGGGYWAAQNGWVIASCSATTGGFLEIGTYVSNGLGLRTYSHSGGGINVFIPVQRGQLVSFYYSNITDIKTYLIPATTI